MGYSRASEFSHAFVHGCRLAHRRSRVLRSLGAFGAPTAAPQALAPSPAPTPAAPTDLTNTTNAKVCGQHIQFALLCVGMSAKALTLVWNWSPKSGVTTLDGYKVYNVTSGKPVLVTQSSAGASNTGILLNPTADGFAGQCYVVRAYKGSIESADSDSACIKGAGVVEPIVLKPSAFGVIQETQYVKAPGNTSDVWPGPVYSCKPRGCIGWTRTEIVVSPLGFSEYNLWARGYIEFDPKRIAATHNITRAVLTLSGSVNKLNCSNGLALGRVGAAAGPWSGESTPVSGNFDVASVVSHKSNGDLIETLDVDVTQAVRNWSSGQPDYGFVIEGTDEDNSPSGVPRSGF